LTTTDPTAVRLHVAEDGAGPPTLVLLHGLSANGAVWGPLVERLRRRFPGRILAPDLRGHGRSPHAAHYGYGQHAADVAALVAPGEAVQVVGHSMGAAIGLVLASGWFGVEVTDLLGFGMKVTWTPEDLARLATLARVPVRWFDTRAEAADRFLRVSGLNKLLPPDSPAVDAGLVAEGERWRLAAPAATAAAAGPPIESIVAAARSRIVLACGSEDALVRIGELRRLAPAALELPGLGHNLHVEDPDTLVRVIEQHLL
jgi:pimeloyl-ACP methyl ester carboxylesterase